MLVLTFKRIAFLPSPYGTCQLPFLRCLIGSFLVSSNGALARSQYPREPLSRHLQTTLSQSFLSFYTFNLSRCARLRRAAKVSSAFSSLKRVRQLADLLFVLHSLLMSPVMLYNRLIKSPCSES